METFPMHQIIRSGYVLNGAGGLVAKPQSPSSLAITGTVPRRQKEWAAATFAGDFTGQPMLSLFPDD